jgi:flagellar biosynthesis protein FliP
VGGSGPRRNLALAALRGEPGALTGSAGPGHCRISSTGVLHFASTRCAVDPMKKFMLAQTRESDLKLFMDLAKSPPVTAPMETPLSVLLPSFITSELRTAFTIGFLIYIPFLVIDLVVASVLMAMGMMMVSPVMIALPFKFLLFVLVDGWALLLGSLAASFAAPLP